MEKEMMDKAGAALKFICNKMGVASEAFWPAFIRKRVMDAVVVFVWLAISVPVALKFAPVCFAWPETAGLDRYDIDAALWGMRLLGVILCGVALNTVHDAIDQIKYLGNLKYWALKDFVKTLGQMIHGDDE